MEARKTRDGSIDELGSYDSEKDIEKSRESRKDKRRDRDRSKEREKDDLSRRHSDKHERKERDRERRNEKDRERHHDREKSRDKPSRDRELDIERDRREERSRKDRDRHDKSRTREKDYEKGEKERLKDDGRERGKEIDQRGKDREKEHKVKDREREENDGGRAKVDLHKAEAHLENQGSYSESGEKQVGSRSTSELATRLKKIKEDRLKSKADDASEVASWLSKSRNQDREKAARMSKILDEQDNAEEESDDATMHGGKDLAGVKILHGLDKVIEGGAVVLTLKDQSILADGDINEEVDMLENVEIGEQKRRDDAYKASKKITYDDDLFNNDINSRRTILPQYDDPVYDEEVTLDEAGRFTGEAEKKLGELRKRIEGNYSTKAYEDLSSTMKTTSDYYTADEMLQFKKPKKKKSLRKREKLDLDALEADAISSGLGVNDLGSRNDSKGLSAKELQAKNEAEMRNNAYQTALAKAEEASKVLHQEQALSVNSVEEDDMVFGEDYEDLQKSLEQARKLALKRKEEDTPSIPEAVALMATANKDKEDKQSSAIVESHENKVVITEMEEFVLGLQLNEETQKTESEDVFEDTDDIPKAEETEMDIDAGGWEEAEEADKSRQPIDSEEKEVVAPDEIIHEVPVGKGLSGALKLLKERGTLKESIDWGGRNMDKKKSKLVGINDNDGPKEIRIDRLDEFGRIMTPKEAFRLISHRFHGKGPGKMKQEKRLKQYQEDLKARQMIASDTPSLSVERMRDTQAQLKSPYIVLSGHVKPGQTSDPRSDFATLEKDHPGSLTPMLGDRKVEHFLGIKRKPDAGGLPPLPPKKPKK